MGLIKRITAAAAALVLMTGCSATIVENPPVQSDSAAEDFNIDDITPGSDFYGYINAQSLMQTELKESESSRGSFSIAQELVEDQLDDMIRDIASSGEEYAAGSNEQLIRAMYALAYSVNSGELDTSQSDEEIIDGLISRIYAAQSIDELCGLWGELVHSCGVRTVFAPSYERDLYGAENYVLYVNYFPYMSDIEKMVGDDFQAVTDRNQFRRYLMCTGLSREEAEQRATEIIYMVLDIAAVTDMSALDNIELEKMYTGLSLSEVDQQLPNIGSSGLLKAMGTEPPSDGMIYFAQPEQAETISSLLDEEHLQAWQDYTVCRFLGSYSDVLPKKYRTGEQSGMYTDEDFALMAVKRELADQVGEEYAKRYFTEDTRDAITDMCEDIREGYRTLIADSEWLSDAGKTALTEKLDMMRFFIGADEPHTVDPDDAALIGGSLLETMIRLRSDYMADELAKAGQPCDMSGFGEMTPQEVNACYMPQKNCFFISVAVLNPPFYDENADYCTNLGGIGATIGHELSHGFDSTGVKYDGTGAFNDTWLPQEDIEAFGKIQERAIDYYNTFTVLDTYHINGRKTLGENLADISGVQCMLLLAGTPEGQREVFENYARIWSDLTIDSAAKSQIRDDEHSPSSVRVNAVVACFDEFYDIYGVTEGDAMYVAPEDRVRRW